jgi:hypothetical protein
METGSLPIVETKPPKLRRHPRMLWLLATLVLLAAISTSYFAMLTLNQRKEKAAAEAIEKAGGQVGRWLWEDSSGRVTYVCFRDQSVADDVLGHLQALSQLRHLVLYNTNC